MPLGYYIFDGEDPSNNKNIIGKLTSIPKVGDEYVYIDYRSQKEVHTGKTIAEVVANIGGRSADCYIKLDDKSIAKAFIM